MGDVIDFKTRKKKLDTEVERSRRPLYSSHLEPNREDVADEDFGERMQRIRASLEKINRIMWELGKNSTDYTH